jgi:hypothetical protein
MSDLLTLSAFCVGIPLLAGWAKVRYWEWLSDRDPR